jgi:hypothetical protein
VCPHAVIRPYLLTKEELDQEEYDLEIEKAGFNDKGRDEHTGY